jgi:hypothetical protein
MGVGCGAPMLDKAMAVGEGEWHVGCASGDRMRTTVGKGNVAVFLRNHETLTVERSSQAVPLSPTAAQARERAVRTDMPGRRDENGSDTDGYH